VEIFCKFLYQRTWGLPMQNVSICLESTENPSYPILIRLNYLRSTDGNVDLAEILERDLVLCPLLVAGIIPAFSKGAGM
jgi:hypothetical protein